MSGDEAAAPRATRKRSRWSRRQKLGAGLGTALAVLALAEGAARIGYHDRWPYYMVFDDELVWAPRPGWSGEVRAGVRAEFNALGLRAAREVGPKERPRVLVVGDSIAYGYALEQDETIPRAMEARWRATRPEAPVEVWNAGVPGYGPEQEAVRLRRLGPAVDPDVVVVLFCLRNDVSVEPIASLLAREGAFNPGQKELAARDPTLRWLLDRSAFAYFVARKLRRWRSRTARAETAEAHAGEGLRFSTLGDFDDLPAEARADELGVLRARLAALEAAARDLGAPALLVLCPGEGLLSGRHDPATVRRVADLADAVGLACLDLLPRYREAGGVGLLRKKDGIHPNPEGAQRIAGWIVEEVAARGWLDGR